MVPLGPARGSGFSTGRGSIASHPVPTAAEREPVIVHLIDGTYELFRHFYGARRGTPKHPQVAAVRGERVVQVDRRSGKVRDEAGVHERFGVAPRQIPDYLALVGDSADGYPGMRGIGPVSAATLVRRHGSIEQFPDTVLGERRELA